MKQLKTELFQVSGKTLQGRKVLEIPSAAIIPIASVNLTPFLTSGYRQICSFSNISPDCYPMDTSDLSFRQAADQGNALG